MLLVAFVLCTLTGCGKKFDPVAYTAVMLEGNFHGKADTEQLEAAGLVLEDITPMYDARIQAFVDAFNEECGWAEGQLSDAAEETLRGMAADLYTKVVFTVGEAQEVDGGYSVAITYTPITFDQNTLIMQGLAPYLVAEMISLVMGGYTSTDDYFISSMNELSETFATTCVAFINQIAAESPVEDSISIVKTDDGYALAEGELDRINDAIIQIIHFEG